MIERLSISISKEMKRQLEIMAKTNFRNLNGEINKALDDYIKRNGIGVDINTPHWWENEPKGSAMEPSKQIVEHNSTSTQPKQITTHQQEPIIHPNTPISTNLFNNDEIEEF